MRFLFDIYDMDGDGVISNGELYSVGWPAIIQGFIKVSTFLRC